MIPGSNILNMAFSVIGQHELTLYKAVGRTVNSVGYDVTSYAAPVKIRGSVQAVPRSRYADLGLDLNENYISLFTCSRVSDVQRGQSGDKILFDCKSYQVTSKTDWQGIDGWQSVICQQLPQGA